MLRKLEIEKFKVSTVEDGTHTLTSETIVGIRELGSKINELIETVNELKCKHEWETFDAGLHQTSPICKKCNLLYHFSERE